jgi:hypothetical protein
MGYNRENIAIILSAKRGPALKSIINLESDFLREEHLERIIRMDADDFV